MKILNGTALKSLLTVAAVTAGVLCFAGSQASAAALKHLVPTDDAFDCYACHKRTTPRIAQNWYESKHGVLLVKCFVCHGQPDGKGSVPWTVSPNPREVCRKCHEPAMKRMEEKFGLELKCNSCHPFHQNSLHHDAYRKSESKRQ